MSHIFLPKLQRVAILLAGLLVLKVTAEVVWGYRNYFPPDFNSDFLRGRDGYFFGRYQWAFYLHIASGPVTLALGMLLISDRFRRLFPSWHRGLGRIQVGLILLFVAPSGLWMAWYADAGPVAAVGFAILALLTGTCAALGLRAAIRRRFAVHRQWMWRCFLLLCSAVVLRVLGGFAVVTEFYAGWYDPLASWASWVLPLAGYELSTLRKRGIGRLSVPQQASARNE